GAKVLGEGTAERSREISLQRIERRIRRPGLLFDFCISLLIVGDEVEELVLHDRSAERGAELMLSEIGLQSKACMRRIGRERSIFAEVVHGSVHLVGATLGDDVDESATRPPELGVRALGGDDHLADGVEIEGERWPLAPALLAEERIVEVGAV